ncbi:hypothetical protein TSUD_299530 [Trifolium subterraneum]|uniref:Uncharacterized protein n=1 Tax=Trifolium subterraneum TaxID=3900 RepID=A0A2Z6P4P9_TRISU|nr:hypothetical protein TSUD_299530 [Trifolium subterraneum]
MPLETCEFSAPIPAIDSGPDIISEHSTSVDSQPTVLSDPDTPVLFSTPLHDGNLDLTTALALATAPISSPLLPQISNIFLALLPLIQQY